MRAKAEVGRWLVVVVGCSRTVVAGPQVDVVVGFLRFLLTFCEPNTGIYEKKIVIVEEDCHCKFTFLKQGPSGDKGDKGEPGPPGSIVSKY